MCKRTIVTTPESTPLHDLLPGAVVWVRINSGFWPAIVLRLNDDYSYVRLLGDHRCAAFELQVARTNTVNYQLNLHHACINDPIERARITSACIAAQNSGLPEQRLLFNSEPFKQFLAFLQSDKPTIDDDLFVLPQLRDSANRQLIVAHNHLRATDAALRSKRMELGNARNLLFVKQLAKFAVQCRSLTIDRLLGRAQAIAREVKDEVATLLLSRTAALAYYRTLKPSTVTPEPVVEDLERARNEAAHWKRQYEEVQKELSADKKRRKLDFSPSKEEVALLPKLVDSSSVVGSNSDGAVANFKQVEDKDCDVERERHRIPKMPGPPNGTNATGRPHEVNENVQLVAEVLSAMRTTASRDIDSNSVVDSTSVVKRPSTSPERPTNVEDKNQSSASPVKTNLVGDEPSSVKPQMMVEDVKVEKSVGHESGEDETTKSSPLVPKEEEKEVHTGKENMDDKAMMNEEKESEDGTGLKEPGDELGPGGEPYATAKNYLGRKMLSQKYATCNPAPDNRARAFVADLEAFLEQHGEKGPRPITIDGATLCLYKLMSMVCGLGGIRNVVQNGQVRGVMLAIGIKKATNSTRVKLYYASNLYRYEHMLAHGELLPKGAGEEIKNMTWRKGRAPSTLNGGLSGVLSVSEKKRERLSDDGLVTDSTTNPHSL